MISSFKHVLCVLLQGPTNVAGLDGAHEETLGDLTFTCPSGNIIFTRNIS